MMDVTEINGVQLNSDSIETIRRFQEDGVESHVEIIETMIDYMIEEGNIPAELNDPRVRLNHIQNLRYLEKLIVTFKKPNSHE